MKTLNIFFSYLLNTKGAQWLHGRYGVLIHHLYPDVRLFHTLLLGDFPSRWLQPLQWPLVSLLGVPDRVEDSVTELMPFMNFLLHSYTCCCDRHASPYWTFIRRWISMRFTPSLLKKTDACWCMLQAGPPFLHYYCAVVFYCCIVLPPVGHSSNHQYHCCQLTRQWSCVSNIYRTFKVVIWLSLVFSRIVM